MENFSFDEWANLYRTDPLEFERRRKQVLEERINQAPEHLRDSLRSIQRRCDIIRKLNTPLDATIEISQMMVDSLNELKRPLSQLSDIIKKT